MSKQELVKYLRTQAYWITVLADEIEQKGTVEASWTVDLKPEYAAEVEAMHKQEEYHHELKEDIEQVPA